MKNRVPDKGYYLTSSLVPELYGWIEVDGKALEVHNPSESQNNSLGYIQAKEHQEFVVCFADLRRTQPQFSYAIHIMIDGTKARGVVVAADSKYETPLDSDPRFNSRRGRLVSETAEQPFLFGKLTTTDSDDACTEEEVVKNLGSIQLRYTRGANYRSVLSSSFPAPAPKVIHEAAKQTQLSHQAAYGPSVEVPKASFGVCDWLDDQNSPFFQLEFRYCSRQLLQFEKHIPSSPAPSPKPASSPAPAFPPDSPRASTSSLKRSTSTARSSQSPELDDVDAERLTRLEAELESLRRQERIAALQREIDNLRARAGSNGAEASTSTRKIKAEPSDLQRAVKKVKDEIADASLPDAPKGSKGKEKEKKKADVIVIDDSD